MIAGDDPRYFGREQSLIKHVILEKYLERFAIIVGKTYDGIVYIDGFSGPWNVQSENLDDASFSIALAQLRKAREAVRKSFGRELGIQCIFLEKEPGAFALLEKFTAAQADADVVALNTDFESAIPGLVQRISRSGRRYFPFIFIDPTGWTGFAMDTIRPLLQIEPGEVLINFMTGFNLRFAEDERTGIDASFRGLFGDAGFREKLLGLEGRKREDALVFEYARRVGEAGRYAHVPVSVVPHPTKDRTHFHLVYASRNVKGLEVFKAAEQHALHLTGAIRADAKRRAREARTNQSEFLTGNDLPETAYLDELAMHYGAMAREAVQDLIRKEREIDFDAAYAVGMRFPLVQMSALRAWIGEIADIINLGERERVPKIGSGHRVRLRYGKTQTTKF